ncbi:hypothetical protein JAAARDRAFT_63551 [Jaapia argillacea MUCL 33604]|uniref:F-box domain-containing protein n=1 Tax=Jaapia argillacea MUCL 33604 TaxID=933084 RepID=A0A067PGT0_9AGAM|nr:hypothetical protein JAAARDRAFT_63551 [Jaapia argillacea MUCL 33604]
MLLALPPELLDKVIDFIDDRPDILSLALTSHFFTERLIPSVLDYREITADHDNNRLWSHLFRNPLLACNIRTLTIDLLTDRRRLPRTCRRESTNFEGDERSEASVLDALSCMAGLQHLRWYWDGDASLEPVGMNPLFASLYASCPNLTSLDIHDVVDTDSQGARLVDRNSQLPLLRNLEAFRYNLLSIEPRPVIPVPYLITFLSGHPHLHYLHLELNDTQLSHYEALAETHLPRLRTFKFRAHEFPPEIFQSFLSCNTTIEILEVRVLELGGSILEGLKEGSVPSLREFTCTKELWPFICLAKPPLRHLNGLRVNEFGENGENFEVLEGVSDTLESVTLSLCSLGATTQVSEVLGLFQKRLPRVKVDVNP